MFLPSAHARLTTPECFVWASKACECAQYVQNESTEGAVLHAANSLQNTERTASVDQVTPVATAPETYAPDASRNPLAQVSLGVHALLPPSVFDDTAAGHSPSPRGNGKGGTKLGLGLLHPLRRSPFAAEDHAQAGAGVDTRSGGGGGASTVRTSPADSPRSMTRQASEPVHSSPQTSQRLSGRDTSQEGLRQVLSGDTGCFGWEGSQGRLLANPMCAPIFVSRSFEGELSTFFSFALLSVSCCVLLRLDCCVHTDTLSAQKIGWPTTSASCQLRLQFGWDMPSSPPIFRDPPAAISPQRTSTFSLLLYLTMIRMSSYTTTLAAWHTMVGATVISCGTRNSSLRLVPPARTPQTVSLRLASQWHLTPVDLTRVGLVGGRGPPGAGLRQYCSQAHPLCCF
jgi:hypothetical protein